MMGAIILANLVLGVALGYALHRSRFCFAGAFRDFILFRDGGLLKALIISLMISTITFALIQYIYLIGDTTVPGNFYPIGLYTIVGGILFGIGMVIAGGCVCSIFLRFGEGFKLFTFVLLGLILGSLVGTLNYPWWEMNFTWVEPVYLAEILSWPIAIGSQLVLLWGLYKIVNRQENNMGGL
ncbi:YeeE/YedE thiosulfate transporter family protein [Desulfuribacillus alkaliarsenatis]|uniref:Uncharacterized protein n=1 Tax=Desulfuribacillus alkaliarsenatis TaxID=766136 RepID=A0A1E5G3N7_9FIRM|nr:YeeE/YedE thiosulfate transporter family protein [Desulfuribacillus alkaliarsenatis]OEF97673.1 hypothetical protein BHF68_14320 [Desulfuribacillus alkaliarsenatis]